MMTQRTSKILRPLVLAVALLTSAPFFVMLDYTLNGNYQAADLTNTYVGASSINTTVVYKS
jgi:hypothetical protein